MHDKLSHWREQHEALLAEWQCSLQVSLSSSTVSLVSILNTDEARVRDLLCGEACGTCMYEAELVSMDGCIVLHGGDR